MLRRVAWYKMEKEVSSENSVTIYQATRHYVPEDRNLNIYCANLNLNLRKPTTAQLNVFLISNLAALWILHSFFSVIPPLLNFTCRRFGTLCSVFIGRLNQTYEYGTEYVHKIQTRGNHPVSFTRPMKKEQSVPKSRNITLRLRGITQNKEYNKSPTSLKLLCLVQNSVYRHFHKIPLLNPILSHINPIHNFTHVFKIFFIILYLRLRYPSWKFQSRYRNFMWHIFCSKKWSPDRHCTFRISTKQSRYRAELTPYKISV